MKLKILAALLLALLMISILTLSVFAHSGGTDSNGGHYDKSTGKYHYHHGKSAHQHPNGVCPYSNTSSNNEFGNSSASEPEPVSGWVIFISIIIWALIMGMAAFALSAFILPFIKNEDVASVVRKTLFVLWGVASLYLGGTAPFFT